MFVSTCKLSSVLLGRLKIRNSMFRNQFCFLVLCSKSQTLIMQRYFLQVDRCFDILNSHSPIAAGYKRPISVNTVTSVQQTLSECVNYMKQLTTIDDKPITSTRRKTFVIGFETAALSYVAVSQKVFQLSPDTKFLLAYKLNQDHLESLFSKIRLRGGWNNNPDALQFQAALKSLLLKNEVESSSSANCLDMNAYQGSFFTFRSTKLRKDALEDTPEIHSLELNTFELQKPVVDVVEYIGE